jgi:hypothetical protein
MELRSHGEEPALGQSSPLVPLSYIHKLLDADPRKEAPDFRPTLLNHSAVAWLIYHFASEPLTEVF